MNFDQLTYTVDEDSGPLQPVLVLSNPSTHLIIVQVNSTDGSAVGEFNLYYKSSSTRNYLDIYTYK